MRAGYFGPPGTFTHEALLEATRGLKLELVPLPSIPDIVIAVRDGQVARGLVPIENSLEGAVNATLDTLVIETDEVAILGEVVYPISQCLIARAGLAIDEIEVVASHPQGIGQCRNFLRRELPRAEVRPASSTAEAVRAVAEQTGPWAALGNRLAAELYGCQVLRAGVQDAADNDTRFVWLGRFDEAGVTEETARPHKTAIVFWGAGTETPGWLVACLSELAGRGVNLTRIESRPRKRRLGQYMFFADLDGHTGDPAVAAGLAGLREHVEVLRVLGSFPAASTYAGVTLS